MIINKWYILAGGSATRWQGYQGVKNKCLLRIDGETLIERTERLLRNNGATDITIVYEGYDSKRKAFEGIAKEAQQPFGILLGDCYYTEAIIKDATHKNVDSWKHYYNCLPNYWTGCSWEEGYIHLVPDWKWWLDKMSEFNKKCDDGTIEFVKDFQIDRYLRGYSPTEYRAFTLDEHDIFWNDETDDFDFPEDYDKFMERHEKNKAKFREDKLSIIIPHYNTPNLLMDLLTKLIGLRNEFPETEIIVVDDGSTTGSLYFPGEIPLYKKDIKIIYQNNRGAAAARNTGLMAATGRYISFIDADDDIEADYLRSIYNIFRNNDCDYILFPFHNVYTGEIDFKHHRQLIGNYAVWAWAFKYDCIGEERFDESWNVAEDVDFLKRVITPEKKRFEATYHIYKYMWENNPNSLQKRFDRGEITAKKEQK